MAQKPITPDQIIEAMRVFEECGRNCTTAAQRMGIPRSTLQSRIKIYGRTFGGDRLHASPADELLAKVRVLEAQLASAHQDTLTARYVKSKIIGLSEESPQVPPWLIKAKKSGRPTGTPTLFLSDLHWGEVVDPNQVGGVNEYNLEIAHQRIRMCVEKTIMLLTEHITTIDYPGIVLALGGDMVSGDIHDELVATNAKEIMPVVLDLWGVLMWVIETLADKFGHVFIPCVTGNHGRNTHKIRAKGRNFTSFDWLLYQFLAKHFDNDPRVQFLIPDGSDAYYRVYEHRYLLTHGDQFRGGDGMIGALGPIIRGDHRKRSRNAQIDMEYDTMLLGHWHQLIQLRRLIVNGSTKGYCEYAWASNFGFEPPQQALWINSPGHGITFSMPVHLGEKMEAPDSWVSWK